MLALIAETWRARDLLLALTAKEIKIRYRRSFLGFFWSLATPLYQVVLMTVVVKYLWHNPTPNYSVNFLCALLPWTFFQQSVLTSCNSVLLSRGMVKSMAFPRQVLPLSIVASCLFHLCMSLIVLAGILLIIPVRFHMSFLFLFVLLAIEVMITSGLALLASALHTFYHDVEYILTNLIAAFFFLTPVIWTLEWIPEHLRPWVMLNPLAVVCEGFRSIIIMKQIPSWESVLVAAAFGVVFLVVGSWYFRRREWQFPEVL